MLEITFTARDTTIPSMVENTTPSIKKPDKPTIPIILANRARPLKNIYKGTTVRKNLDIRSKSSGYFLTTLIPVKSEEIRSTVSVIITHLNRVLLPI
jgi:hypothetical protein